MPTTQTPPCRVCRNPAPVIQYPGDAPHLAICPDCCDKTPHVEGDATTHTDVGHEWEYDPHERDRVCVRCGIPRRCTEYGWED